MPIFRFIALAFVATAVVAAAAPLTLAPLPATAADPVVASAPVPLVKIRGSISPSRRLVPGTPLTFKLDTLFTTRPPGADLVLQRLDYLFAHGTVVNGRLFPSCTVATLDRAHGRLSACPPGSKIGGGIATGTAVELGVTADAVVTLFNGPGGRSITMNANITTPALIDVTFSAPFVTLHHGRWANRLSIVLPESLRSVLGGDVTTSKIDVTTGATRVVHGVRRGYIEAVRCPRSGRAPIHGDFAFSQGATASADTTATC